MQLVETLVAYKKIDDEFIKVMLLKGRKKADIMAQWHGILILIDLNNMRANSLTTVDLLLILLTLFSLNQQYIM